MTEQKVQTAFPTLTAAMGINPANIEVVKPGVNGNNHAADTNATNSTTTTEEEQNPEPVPGQTSGEPAKVLTEDEISDEIILKALNKKNGTKYKSLDELSAPKKELTKEEKEAAEATKKAKALEWALGTERIKREDYESSVVDRQKSDRQIALELFTNELREEDKDITTEEAEERFKDFFNEDAEEKSWRYKKSQKEIEKIAQEYRKGKYSSVDSIETDYESYMQSEQRQEGFGKQVKSVVESLPKELVFEIPYKNASGTDEKMSVSYPVDESDIKALKKAFLGSADMYEVLGADKNDIKDSVLSEEMVTFLRAKNLDKIIQKAATDFAEKRVAEETTALEARLKGVPSTQVGFGGSTAGDASTKKTPPEHKSLKQRMGW